jgi:hypothetical protein
MDELHSTTASNYGHITKRLFPALEEKFASLENSLATTTQALEAKGVSLLAKFTALENTVSTVVEGRLVSLESAVESKHAPALCASGPREPPDDPPPGATPGMAATHGRVGVLGGTFVPPAYDAPRPCVEHEDVSGEDDNSPVDASIDVNARTRLAYEDNDGCTSMGNAQKPTPRTRHIDIKYFALCDWIKRDLIILERIDTSINLSDHLTKTLSRILFHRHAKFPSRSCSPSVLASISTCHYHIRRFLQGY